MSYFFNVILKPVGKWVIEVQFLDFWSDSGRRGCFFELLCFSWLLCFRRFELQKAE